MTPRKPVPNWAVRVRSILLGALDSAAWAAGLAMAAATRLSIADTEVDWTQLVWLAAAASVVQIAVGVWARGLLGGFRIGSVDEAVGVVKGWAVTSVAVAALDYLVLDRPVPTMALVLSLPLVLSLMLGVRLGWRVWQDHGRRPQVRNGTKRVLVFGAGEGAEQIVRAMTRDPDSKFIPVALLDDDPMKARRQISGVRVRGTRNDLGSVARATKADILLIAIPSAKASLIAELDERGQAAGLDVRVLPSTTELVGLLTTGDIRELTEADLLGRDEVEVDMASIQGYLTGKRVLVTGAGGSIGSELCRQLAQLDCESLVMLDRDESGLHSTQLAIEGRALLDTRSLVVADIRDRARVFEVFEEHRPHVVFHAAALKHLTLLEQYPEEGRKTNVEGSRNVLDAAETFGVTHYVNVSTDKAADPSSVLGRTKREAEQLTAAKAGVASGTFVSVRFGNVLGSRGSVLPIFRHQIAKGGPITVTHPDVTRYFMTIPEAVRLVLQAGAIGRPGEVMILDMGAPVKIVDLAKQLIRHFGTDTEIVFTGLRPGEKMDEILISSEEVAETREHPRIMHAVPHQTFTT
jgi:FlaA1/EpsC-like NDP-sugar epimerase